MSDPVDHALRQLKRAPPEKAVFITLVHQQSGARKVVQYLGMSGIPLRAQIFWPIAGDYLIAPKSGTLIGPRASADRLRHWKVCSADHALLKREYREHLTRQTEGLVKCC